MNPAHRINVQRVAILPYRYRVIRFYRHLPHFVKHVQHRSYHEEINVTLPKI